MGGLGFSGGKTGEKLRPLAAQDKHSCHRSPDYQVQVLEGGLRVMSLSSDKSWVNLDLNVGFQAAGVVRQRGFKAEAVQIIDMRCPQQSEIEEPDNKKKRKREKNETLSSSSKGSSVKDRFDPLLQLFASRLSSKTREFTLANA